MKTVTLEESIKETRQNKQDVLNIMRSISKSDFNYGDRQYDRPRKNNDKAKVLKRLETRANSDR